MSTLAPTTRSPTSLPSAIPTISSIPTPTPSASPTSLFDTYDRSIEDDPTSPAALAYNLMKSDANISTLMLAAESDLQNGTEPLYNQNMTLRKKLFQRFGVLTTWLSLAGEDALNDAPPPIHLDECDWHPVVTCGDEGFVTAIRIAGQGWSGGVIPSAIRHLERLRVLDLSVSGVQGSIPEEVYGLTELQRLYLDNNHLTGTLSESFGNLYDLREVYLTKNKFTGTFPIGLGSNGTSTRRRLRYLSLSHNQLSGTFPSNLRLRFLFYLDLSHNQFSGHFTSDTFDKWVTLRHVYLDNNHFTGSVPETLVTAGNGRMRSIYLNNNKFSGEFPNPKDWLKDNNQIATLRLENNQLTGELSYDLCYRGIMQEGEMVELKADCGICSCKEFCAHCKESNEKSDKEKDKNKNDKNDKHWLI